MPKHLNWEARYSVGNETLDGQHERFFELCNALADCLEDAEGQGRFDRLFAEMMDKAREHFATEEQLLAACGYPELDALLEEQQAFAYLVKEIATTEKFSREELQSFIALWWVGHVMSAARSHSQWLMGRVFPPAE